MQYIKLEAILPYLNKYHLLTDSENDDLLNVVLSERIRVLKLIHFIEGKGPEGFQRFLTALAEEPDHLGHKELAQLFSPYHIRKYNFSNIICACCIILMQLTSHAYEILNMHTRRADDIYVVVYTGC